MHRTMEYTDSFSSGRALHEPIGSYRGNGRRGGEGGGGSQFCFFFFRTAFSVTSSARSGVYHIDVLGSISDKSVH